MTKEIHILSLGAGVQSTALYLMDLDGDLDVKFDYAILADPGDEPKAVYEHLEWLKTLGGAELLIRSNGCLGDDILKGQNSTGHKFNPLPVFTKNEKGGVGQLRRQCTSEYKIQVVEQTIRREILGLKPRQRVPKGVKIWQYVGFSMDEPGRAARARGRFNARGWTDVRFPLIEDCMTRQDCINYLEKRVPHNVPRSACVYCPYKSNREWLRLKKAGGPDWKRAVQIDDSLRSEGGFYNRNQNSEVYIHRSCKPLKDCKFDEDQMDLFDLECEGGCGL
tara:strand:+ start:547 stop:1380 length:834 start_codon:yes stop_codon:yes gene_type:complete